MCQPPVLTGGSGAIPEGGQGRQPGVQQSDQETDSNIYSLGAFGQVIYHLCALISHL